jgi:DNA polymerase-3 subunit delta'
MNVSSQNRILKTLEEPPEDVVIFMTSSNGEKLLPTVLSRVQLIKLHGLKESSITTFLVNTYETEDDTAKFASKMSGGSLKQAIDFVTNEEFKKAQEEVYELMVALTKKDKPSVLGSMSFFNSDKEQINSRLDYMLLWYRDLLLFKKSKVKEVLVHIQSLDFIKKAARQYSVKRLIENIEVIEQTKQKLNQHGNFDLTIEYMLVKLLEE